MTPGSYSAPRLPTLCGMLSFRPCRQHLACVALGALFPAVSAAQNGSIVASATVLPRPLSLLGVARTASPGGLLLRIDGCGSGAISVDSRRAGGVTVRTAYVPLTAAATCGERSVTLQLAQEGTVGPTAFVVSLEQADAMLSPSFAQFVVPAATLAPALRASLGY